MKCLGLSNIQSNKDIECILEFGDVFKILIETFEENIDKILNKVNVDEYDNELLELLLNS
jgi:hypothetical protein